MEPTSQTMQAQACVVYGYLGDQCMPTLPTAYPRCLLLAPQKGGAITAAKAVRAQGWGVGEGARGDASSAQRTYIERVGRFVDNSGDAIIQNLTRTLQAFVNPSDDISQPADHCPTPAFVRAHVFIVYTHAQRCRDHPSGWPP